MQYRLSTLLLAFVVVYAALAMFGGWGIIVAGFLLAVAAYIRNAKSMKRTGRAVFFLLTPILLLFLYVVLIADPYVPEWGCAFKLRSIGIALTNYGLTRGNLPPVTTDKNGKPMHSWRDSFCRA